MARIRTTYQIGDKVGQSLELDIGSIQTKHLGMGASATSGTSIVGARIDPYTAVQAGDIKINGQNVGAIAASASGGGNMKAALTLSTTMLITLWQAL